ncbi:MAG: FMN-binding protein [Halarsenatibacteraceae bacterium]
MPEWFVEANSADVDVYSGATGSSNMWQEAVANALSKAGL